MYVSLVIPEIHSLDVLYNNLRLINPLLACQVHVVLMLFVESKTEQVPVSVYQNTLVIHTKVVVPNVFSTQIVPQIVRAYEINVRIRAQEHAAKMLCVMLPIILLYATV